MKIKSVVAVGSMGVGLGIAGLVGAGTASAACEDTTPALTPQRVSCVAAEQTNEFLRTADPAYNANILLYGTVEDGKRSGLGLVDQPATFASSVQDFFDGPRSPDPGPDPAGPNTPAP